ncbi:hypothetical protein COI44_08530 [Bacillus sp. AFS088145]|nr:hypothetical protein COI44_08530 [Bacillus sp. AFS088145]
MYEGRIIQHYRKKQRLTQEQLGQDICSVTHLSKIECSRTTYAPEIVSLLASRLGITMEKEVEKLHTYKSFLAKWEYAITMRLRHDMDGFAAHLINEDLISLSEHYHWFLLLHAKYCLLTNQLDQARQLIKLLEKKKQTLSFDETQRFHHVKGMFYLVTYQANHAIPEFEQIDETVYPAIDYLYHLALAYELAGLSTLAYYYADKANRLFTENRQFLLAIEAERIMLAQLTDLPQRTLDFRLIQLLQSCDLCQAVEQKAMILCLFGDVHLKRHDKEQGAHYYLYALNLLDKQSVFYLTVLERHLRLQVELDFLNKHTLLPEIEVAKQIASDSKQEMFVHLFQLLIYQASNNLIDYRRYLEKKALPAFLQFGVSEFIQLATFKIEHLNAQIPSNELALT